MDSSGSSLSDEGGPAGSPLQVHVRPLHGQIFTIEVGANWTVETMKHAIERIEGTPVSWQRLSASAGAPELSDEREVGECGVVDGAQLVLESSGSPSAGGGSAWGQLRSPGGRSLGSPATPRQDFADKFAGVVVQAAAAAHVVLPARSGTVASNDALYRRSEELRLAKLAAQEAHDASSPTVQVRSNDAMYRRSLLRLAVKEAVHERAVAEARAQAEREAAAQAEPVETLFDFSSQQKKVSSNGSLFRRMEAHRAAVEERKQQKRQEAEEQERSIMRKASPVRPPSAKHWSRRQPEPEPEPEPEPPQAGEGELRIDELELHAMMAAALSPLASHPGSDAAAIPSGDQSSKGEDQPAVGGAVPSGWEERLAQLTLARDALVAEGELLRERNAQSPGAETETESEEDTPRDDGGARQRVRNPALRLQSQGFSPVPTNHSGYPVQASRGRRGRRHTRLGIGPVSAAASVRLPESLNHRLLSAGNRSQEEATPGRSR